MVVEKDRLWLINRSFRRNDRIGSFCIANPKGSISQLVNHIDCSRRTAESHTTKLKNSEALLCERDVQVLENGS